MTQLREVVTWFSSNSATLNDYVQIGAILIGGWWTYRLFIRGRQHKQKAELALGVAAIGLNNERRYIRVEFTLRNIGNVMILPRKAHCSVQQIVPHNEAVRKAIASWFANFDTGASEEESDAAVGDANASDEELCEDPWPLDCVEIQWPVVDDWCMDLEHEDDAVTLEPQESETWQADFVLCRVLRHAQINVTVQSTEGFLWDSTKLVDFDQIDMAKDAAQSLLVTIETSDDDCR